ncbi:MAG: Spermidine/putrescine import ABC transporter ATP-binding protein PotA, partial [uncultured Frankineae bacterium]
ARHRPPRQDLPRGQADPSQPSLRCGGAGARLRRQRRQLRGQGGGAVHPARPLRLREDHDAACRGRARAAGRRAHRPGGPGAVRARGHRPGHDRPRQQARPRDGVPVLRDLAAHDRVRQRRVPAAGPQSRDATERRRDPGAGRPRPAHDGARAPGGPAGDQAVRRSAAAARARPRAGHRAAPAAARRAAVQPRRQAAGVPALRAQAAAARARHHVDLRDARPDRGPRPVHQDRGHERRPGRAARQAPRDLREPQQQVRRRVHRHVELHDRHGPVAQRRPLRGHDHRRAAVAQLAGRRPAGQRGRRLHPSRGAHPRPRGRAGRPAERLAGHRPDPRVPRRRRRPHPGRRRPGAAGARQPLGVGGAGGGGAGAPRPLEAVPRAHRL